MELYTSYQESIARQITGLYSEKQETIVENKWWVRHTRIGQAGAEKAGFNRKAEATAYAKRMKSQILADEGYTVHGNIQKDEVYWVYCNGLQVGSIEVIRYTLV